VKHCPSCGALNGSAHAVCRVCGEPLLAPADAAPQSAREVIDLAEAALVAAGAWAILSANLFLPLIYGSYAWQTLFINTLTWVGAAVPVFAPERFGQVLGGTKKPLIAGLIAAGIYGLLVMTNANPPLFWAVYGLLGAMACAVGVNALAPVIGNKRFQVAALVGALVLVWVFGGASETLGFASFPVGAMLLFGGALGLDLRPDAALSIIDRLRKVKGILP